MSGAMLPSASDNIAPSGLLCCVSLRAGHHLYYANIYAFLCLYALNLQMREYFPRNGAAFAWWNEWVIDANNEGNYIVTVLIHFICCDSYCLSGRLFQIFKTLTKN